MIDANLKNYLIVNKEITMKYPLLGVCQCGNVQYQLTEPFIKQIVCHCSECQKLSATSFSITAILKQEAFQLLSGQLKIYSRKADSGSTVNNYFCPDCGNRIYHQNPDKPELLRIKPGTLLDTSVIDPTIHVWLQSKQQWVVIPDNVEKYQTQPI